MAFFALFSTSLFLSMLPLALCSGLLFDMPAKVMFYAFWGAFAGAMCNVGLMLAYKHSDISLAYPMARALPVFLTMAATLLFHWGKPLSLIAVIGMIVIFTGCFRIVVPTASNSICGKYLWGSIGKTPCLILNMRLNSGKFSVAVSVLP
jgi:multidrug transporter EmrE-like cation transporter